MLRDSLMHGCFRTIDIGNIGLFNLKSDTGSAIASRGTFVGTHIHGGQYNIGGFDGKINFLGTDAL